MNKMSVQMEGLEHCAQESSVYSFPVKDPYKGITEANKDEAQDVPQPLDGGWGWMVVIGVMIVNAIVMSLIMNFGMLANELIEIQPGISISALMWIPALQMALLNGLCPFTCAFATNIFNHRGVTLAGGIISALSLGLSSISASLPVLYFTFGVMGGTGLGMSIFPGNLLVTSYFDKRRGLACGLASLGSGIGSLCMPLILDFLLTKYGFEGCTLILSGVALNICVGASLYRPLQRPKRKNTLNRACRGQENAGNLNPVDIPTDNSDAKLESMRFQSSLKNEPLVVILKYITNHSEEDLSAVDQSFFERNCSSLTQLSAKDHQTKTSKLCNHLRSIIDVSLFSMPQFYFLAVSYNMLVLALINVVAYIPQYIVAEGYTPDDAAWFMLMYAIANTCGGLLVPLASDHITFHIKYMFCFFGLLAASTTIAFTLMDEYISHLATLLVYSFSIGGTLGLVLPLLLQYIASSKFSAFYGMIHLIHSAVAISFTPLIGRLVDWKGYSASMAVLACIQALSSVLVLFDVLIVRKSKTAA